ncbi:MAG TPA: hypothetical protein VJ654_12020 [Noviherbaspirillum sp.]|nr:hypothetical protein [Noviherbaspirillum sp.]
MSVSSVTQGSYNYSSTPPNGAQQRRENFEQLSQSLQAGDLSGAKQAFAALSQSGKTRDADGDGDGDRGNGQGGTRANDLKQLAQALQSNDLAGAQKAFAALKQDATNARSTATQAGQAAGRAHHTHHHHSHSAQQSVQTATDQSDKNTAATGTVGTNINVSV